MKYYYNFYSIIIIIHIILNQKLENGHILPTVKSGVSRIFYYFLLKCKKMCSVFGLGPSVLFCLAKNFHFSASLIKMVILNCNNILQYYGFIF